MSNIVGNRHSTPEATNNLRLPNQRSSATGHLLRASADMSNTGASSPLSGRSIRPASEVYLNQAQNGNGDDATDSAAQKWISDIDQFETTLEEMAAATVDQEFKGELSAIEQWFEVLTEAERTAALYALLQQTTQVQIRFFIQVLKEMAKAHPAAGVLSPANFGEKDAMSNRMSDASGKLGVAGTRESMGRPPPSPVNKRNSGLPQETINAMFPAAASAIASQKAEYTQQTGNNPPPSNRNSAAFTAGDRSSLLVPSGSGEQAKDASAGAQTPASPWGQRPKSSEKGGQPPMGQFQQPPPSAGLRSGRPSAMNPNPMQSEAGNAQQMAAEQLSNMMSPAFGNSWASMTNTPMVPNFNQAPNQADMIANATAMKLAAMSTVNNRVMLDDARKYRRARSNEGKLAQTGLPMSPGMPGAGNVLVVSESGQLMNAQFSPQQLQALQLQQANLLSQRSRPTSPGNAMRSPAMAQASPGTFMSPQANGFLAAYDGGLATGMSGMSLNQFALNSGSVSGEDMERGRSPRGRRGSSKPPEDPTDISLLKDVPAWLRMLRLHKYTDNLKDIKWQELVQLDDDALEKKGVSALGARRKLLKAFEQVREAQATGKLT